MAFVRDPREEQQKALLSAGSAGVTAPPAPGTPGGAAVGKSGGKPFVTLAAYLDANKANIGQTAQGLSRDIQGEVDTTRAGIDRDAEAAMAGVNSGVVTEGAPMGGLLRQKYVGPEGFDGSPYMADVNRLGDRAKLTESAAGLGELLKPMYGGRYTRGKASLDSALLRGDKNASQTLAGARESAGGLGAYLDSKAAGVNSAIGARNAGIKDNNDRYAWHENRAKTPTVEQTVETMTKAPRGAAMDLGGGLVGFGTPTTPGEKELRDARNSTGSRAWGR